MVAEGCQRTVKTRPSGRMKSTHLSGQLLAQPRTFCSHLLYAQPHVAQAVAREGAASSHGGIPGRPGNAGETGEIPVLCRNGESPGTCRAGNSISPPSQGQKVVSECFPNVQSIPRV